MTVKEIKAEDIINAEIVEIENRIREVSNNIRFNKNNPVFLKWYQQQVDRITELKEILE